MTIKVWLREFWWAIPCMLLLQAPVWAQPEWLRSAAALMAVMAMCAGTCAVVFWQLLKINRRRVTNARAELATALSDADYNLELTAHLLERLGNAESEVMRLSGQLRARELEDAARRRRMAN